jgi:hypothetical protein
MDFRVKNCKARGPELQTGKRADILPQAPPIEKFYFEEEFSKMPVS